MVRMMDEGGIFSTLLRERSFLICIKLTLLWQEEVAVNEGRVSEFPDPDGKSRIATQPSCWGSCWRSTDSATSNAPLGLTQARTPASRVQFTQLRTKRRYLGGSQGTYNPRRIYVRHLLKNRWVR